MTHNQVGSFDFDPSRDYVAEVRAEQGEGSGEASVDMADAVGAQQFEADTLSAVARANEATVPTPEVEAELTRIEEELHGGGLQGSTHQEVDIAHTEALAEDELRNETTAAGEYAEAEDRRRVNAQNRAEEMDISHEQALRRDRANLSPSQVELLANEYRKDYELVGPIINEAANKYYEAVRKYGQEDLRTRAMKNEWDDVARVQERKSERIQDLIDEFPDSQKFFRAQ